MNYEEKIEKIEKMIIDKNLTAPRLTPEDIEAKIRDVTYTNLPSGKAVVCEITLENGFSVRGESAVVAKENFDQSIGNMIALKNAREKIWQLEGYLLQEQLYNTDYKSGYATEQTELSERMMKLLAFINSHNFERVKGVEATLLRKQLSVMQEYNDILLKRLVL